MTYITLCSGIECASVAALPLGWEPICFSEIEPFPSAVLAHHYPEVPNVGDMTTHDWRQYRGRCDAIIAGTPCQAFSIAGLGDSLDDERGQLTLKFVEICNDVNPTVIVWENVPGVLSTKDNAFGCLLGAMVGESSPIVPVGKWTDAGVVVGPERRIAWRILDAQYFGLAQRRRRLFLVASPRTGGIDPAKVLFEFEGVRRYSPPSRSTQEDPAAGAGGSAAGGGEWGGDSVAGTVSAKWAKGTGGPSGDECQNLVAGAICADSFSGGAGGRPEGAAANHFIPVVAGTLGGGSGNRGWQSGLDMSGAFIPMVTGTLSHGGKAAGSATQQDAEQGMLISHTLRGNGFDASEDGSGRGTPLIPATYAIKTTNTKQNGRHYNKDTAFTLDRAQVQAIAFSCKDHGNDAGDLAPTLRSMNHNHSHANGGGQVAVASVLTSAVRRLTPRECERLQGFPDDYTKIPWRGRTADDCTDGPRYKAIGNSMPERVMRWIFGRVDQAMAAQHSFSEDREG